MAPIRATKSPTIKIKPKKTVIKQPNKLSSDPLKTLVFVPIKITIKSNPADIPAI